MRKKGRSKRKRRTRAHVIADLSVNHVERHVLRCGFGVEITRHDYGVDLMLFFYARDGQLRDGQVLLQLKATDSLKTVRDRTAVSFSVDRRDLDFWLSVAQPVILVIYDARADRAYWLYVQAHFGSPTQARPRNRGKSVSIRVPLKNILNRRAILQFERYNDNVVRQLHGVIRHHD